MATNSTSGEKDCGVSHDTLFISISVKFIYTKQECSAENNPTKQPTSYQ